jgi:hypothetical protein
MGIGTKRRRLYEVDGLFPSGEKITTFLQGYMYSDPWRLISSQEALRCYCAPYILLVQLTCNSRFNFLTQACFSRQSSGAGGKTQMICYIRRASKVTSLYTNLSRPSRLKERALLHGSETTVHKILLRLSRSNSIGLKLTYFWYCTKSVTHVLIPPSPYIGKQVLPMWIFMVLKVKILKVS